MGRTTKTQRANLTAAEVDRSKVAFRALRAADLSKLSTRDAAEIAGILSRCLKPHDLLRLLVRHLPVDTANVIRLDVARAQRV